MLLPTMRESTGFGGAYGTLKQEDEKAIDFERGRPVRLHSLNRKETAATALTA